jgi:hypothetical protein
MASVREQVEAALTNDVLWRAGSAWSNGDDAKSRAVILSALGPLLDQQEAALAAAIAPWRFPVWKCQTCGCLWLDTLDNFVSLLDGDQKSCDVCEHGPTREACEITWFKVVPLARAARLEARLRAVLKAVQKLRPNPWIHSTSRAGAWAPDEFNGCCLWCHAKAHDTERFPDHPENDCLWMEIRRALAEEGQ